MTEGMGETEEVGLGVVSRRDEALKKTSSKPTGSIMLTGLIFCFPPAL